MKFLLFNLAVAGALVFLFTSDRGDLRALADRAFDATQTAKQTAQKAVGSVMDGSANRRELPDLTPLDTGAPTPPDNPSPAAGSPPGTTAPKSADPPSPETRSAATPSVAVPETAASAAPPETMQRRVVTGPPRAITGLPPEVAKRRAEVLGDMAPSASGKEKTIDVTVKKFMSPAERRRDLMLLSEEMELLSAGSIGQ